MLYSIKKLTAFTILLAVTLTCVNMDSYAQKRSNNNGSYLKTSLNAYSFNTPLLKEKIMNLDQLLEYCAEKDIDGVDLTGYYFPGYPEVPSYEYLYHIKQKAFLLGVEISGTGVINNFSSPDVNLRKEGVQLVKDWIIAAEKLGASVVRVFSGESDLTGYTR